MLLKQIEHQKKFQIKETTFCSEGFTLVELLVVIAILGILSGIAIPLFLGERTKAAQAEAKTNIDALRLVLEQNFAENSCYYRDSTNTCKNTTLSDVAAIRAAFSGFKPGTEADLKFTYSVEFKGASPATEFQVIAIGKSSTNVEGSKFCVNHNNDRVCP